MQYPDVNHDQSEARIDQPTPAQSDEFKPPFSHGIFRRDIELLTRALDASICGIVLTDNSQADNPIIYCNAAFERISGYSRKEIIGRNCRFLQGDDRDQKQRQQIRNAIVNGQSCAVEIRNYKKDGSLFWNELSLSPVKNEQGIVTHFIGVQSDVSEKKIAQLALLQHQQEMEQQIQERTKEIRASEQYLASIVSTVRQSLMVLDKDRRVLSVNDYFLKTFKVTLSETQGSALHNLGNGQWNIPELQQMLNEVLPTSNPVQDFEVAHDFPRIGKKLMLLNAHRVEFEGRYHDRILIAIEDITGRRELEKRKDDFLAVASHELKTPLTSIKGYMQLLRRYTLNGTDEKLIGIVEKTNLFVDRLSNLVKELLDVSRIQRGKFILYKKPFEFERMVHETVEAIQTVTRTPRIEVSGQAAFSYTGDESHITQVLNNLLSNAVKYAAGTDKIMVHLSLAGDFLKVSVTDYGLGIEVEDQKMIFDRFFRASAVQQRFPGLGIGLYVCSQIVNSHGGNLWVQSEPGAGSTFSFTLPLFADNDADDSM